MLLLRPVNWAALALCLIVSARGQQLLADAPAPINPSVTAEPFSAILRRLDEQEAELAKLRGRIEGYERKEAEPPSENRPASIPVPLPEVPQQPDVVYQLQQQVAALEKMVQQQNAASQAAGLPAVGPGSGYEVGSDLAMSGKWNNMYEVKTKNGDFRAHVGGCVQFDITAFDNDPEIVVPPADGGIGPQPNSLTLRRARIRLDGSVWEVIEYRAEYEFANALSSSTASPGQPVSINPALTDFWISWTHIPVIGNVKVGNQKEPMGMEHMMAYMFTDFLERSYLQDIAFGPFTNGFSPGVAAFNWTEDERATWALGWFGNSSDVFGYSLGNDFAFTGRVTWLPYYDELTQGRYLWHVGASGSTRGPDEGLVRLRTRGNIRSGPPGTLNPIYADTQNMAADSEQLVNLESAVQWGPWSVQAEYTAIWVPGAVQPFSPALGVARGTPFFQGGYVEVMYFVTGEHRQFNKRLGALDRPIVYTPMFILGGRNGCCTGSGAVQVGCRYSAMDLNDNGINGGYLQSMTWGLNWFLNPNTKVQFNYDLTHRTEVLDTPAGFINSFGTRFSIDF